MSEAMWFVWGLLWGGGACAAVFLCLPKEKHLPPPRKKAPPPKGDRKAWGQNHNFLYYDGTMMPEIKEDLNE